jgi:hypothetical protein
MIQLPDFEGFEWDNGNSTKNWEMHQVRREECEQAFFNRPWLVAEDARHSEAERRFVLLGRTDSGRHLMVVFVKRGKLVRVISARDMTKKERRAFHDFAS